MNIKTSHLILGAIALIALSQGESIKQSIAKNQAIKQDQLAFNERLRKNRDDARNAQDLSKVAIERYKANCILIKDQKTGKEAYFREGATTVDSALNRRVRDNAIVCNRLGDTAVIQDGLITDIARVALADKPEMQNLLDQQGR
ncbi:hypothetical protein ACKFKF_11590 [Phormidesmis sp. 146-12]